MGKKGPLWWRESDWLLRGSSAANQILLRHSGPILSDVPTIKDLFARNLPLPLKILSIKDTIDGVFNGQNGFWRHFICQRQGHHRHNVKSGCILEKTKFATSQVVKSL